MIRVFFAVFCLSTVWEVFQSAGSPHPSVRPCDCNDIQAFSQASGVYMIFPEGTAGFPVYCDMDRGTGGWTVIQRRVNGSEDFFRMWEEYTRDLEHEFWLGNQQINAIVSQGWYELRIDMIGPNFEQRYAGYHIFSIDTASNKYALTVHGYHGDAGDHMLYMNGVKFTTRDNDNDSHSSNCARSFRGAWWYTDCHSSNLNGLYGDTRYAKGITWRSLSTYYKSLLWVDMKVRRWRRE